MRTVVFLYLVLHFFAFHIVNGFTEQVCVLNSKIIFWYLKRI